MTHFLCIAPKINIGLHVKNRAIPENFAKKLIILNINICKFCGINYEGEYKKAFLNLF